RDQLNRKVDLTNRRQTRKIIRENIWKLPDHLYVSNRTRRSLRRRSNHTSKKSLTALTDHPVSLKAGNQHPRRAGPGTLKDQLFLSRCSENHPPLMAI